MASHDDRTYQGEFYRAVDQRQGIDRARQEQFYVPIYDRPELIDYDVVELLFNGIEFSIGQSVQMLSGFRGSGKTSELLRLQNRLVRSGYACIYFDVEDYFNTELPIDSGAFALGLAAGFANGCERDDVGPGSVSDRLRGMLGRLTLDVGISASAGPIGVEIKAALRDDDSFREKIAQTMQKDRRAFRRELHNFFTESAAALESQNVVFIVDSIDHFRGRTERFQEVRESVERVFTELAEDLTLPGIHAIYTTPVYVRPSLGVVHDLLNIRVTDKDGAPSPAGRDALVEVIRRRAPGGDYERLLDDHVDQLVVNSGGLIRDLLRLTGALLLRARSLPITDAVLLQAEQEIRAQMELALSQEQLEILRRVEDTHQLTPAREEWPDATDLMARGAILRYPNGQRPWYGVHPLLRPLL